MISARTTLRSPTVCAAFLALLLPSVCLAAPPNFVPLGWKRVNGQSNRSEIQFRSPDGRAALTMRDVATSKNSPIGIIQPRAGEEVTYKTRGQNWWVFSGYRGEDIFYRRAAFACNHHRIHVIELLYPRYQKRQFDSIVTSISHRLQHYREVCPKGAASRS